MHLACSRRDARHLGYITTALCTFEFVSSRFFQSEMQRQSGNQAPYFCPIELSTLVNKVRPPPPPSTMLVTMIPIFREKNKILRFVKPQHCIGGAGVDEHYWRRLCPAPHLVRLVMSKTEDDRRRPERTPPPRGVVRPLRGCLCIRRPAFDYLAVPTE